MRDDLHEHVETLGTLESKDGVDAVGSIPLPIKCRRMAIHGYSLRLLIRYKYLETNSKPEASNITPTLPILPPLAAQNKCLNVCSLPASHRLTATAVLSNYDALRYTMYIFE